jgi:CheY-like chemotaxis protein
MATIMVVDDEPVILETVVDVLTAEGHGVLSAMDGLAAQVLLTATVPDLLVTDVMMPRLDGLGLVRWMRTRPELVNVPVVLISATSSPELDGLGPVTFLPKPFDLTALLHAVTT